jgi:isopentenyl-diphosphate Delta-isomerase
MQTTDDQDEIFDVVDRDDRIVGQAPRRLCNSDPKLIHRAVFVLVYNDKDQILWQKRSMTKDVCPGGWTTSVSGHVDRGETYAVAAAREMREELGIETPLEYHGKAIFNFPSENEYSALFTTRSQGPFTFDPAEISALEFMDLQELFRREQADGLVVTAAVRKVVAALRL